MITTVRWHRGIVPGNNSSSRYEVFEVELFLDVGQAMLLNEVYISIMLLRKAQIRQLMLSIRLLFHWVLTIIPWREKGEESISFRLLCDCLLAFEGFFMPHF